QVCSGGPDGGMDVTGNQCNAWVATSLPTGTEDVPATVLMPAPSRAANDAAIRRTSLLVDESPASAAPAALLRARQERSSGRAGSASGRSEEHTSELQSRENLVCRLLLEKKT